MLSGLGAGRQCSLISLARGHIAAKLQAERCPGTLLLSMTMANKCVQLQQSQTEMQHKTMQVFSICSFLYVLGFYHLILAFWFDSLSAGYWLCTLCSIKLLPSTAQLLFLHFVLSKISTCMVLVILGEWHALEDEVTLVSGRPQFLVQPAQRWSGSSQMTITRLNTNSRAEFSSTTSTLLSWTAGVWCLDLRWQQRNGWASHKRVGTTRSISWTRFPRVLEEG